MCWILHCGWTLGRSRSGWETLSVMTASYQTKWAWVFYCTGWQRRGQSCRRSWWGHHLLGSRKRKGWWLSKTPHNTRLFQPTFFSATGTRPSQRHTLVLVLDGHLVAALQLPPEHALHHQHQLIVGDVLIMDGDASDVVAQLGFDDQLPT